MFVMFNLIVFELNVGNVFLGIIDLWLIIDIFEFWIDN